MTIIHCVDHHFCDKMPEHFEIYRMENKQEFLFNIGHLLAINVEYCPYCGYLLTPSKY